MKKLFLVIVAMLTTSIAFAQGTTSIKDSSIFKGRFYNKEYNVYIQLNAYQRNVRVPGQDIFGELPGFLGDNQDARKWLFTDVELSDSTIANLTVINDYGSEDLMATFEKKNDGTFELQQGKGSDMKIARNSKWVKLPKKLAFVKQ